LGTSIGFTLLLALGFSLLRPYNSVVYSPKLKIADEKHAPPPMGKGMLAWVAPVLKTKEQELVDLIGTVLGCGILIPLNLAQGQKFSSSNAVSKITPVNTFGSANWGMTICAWLFNIIVAGYLWWNYRAILRLRRQYYDSPEYRASLHARTLMVRQSKFFQNAC
jgi:hypothetical protein